MKIAVKFSVKSLSGVVAATLGTGVIYSAPALSATFAGTFTVQTDPTVPLPASSYTGTYSFESSGQSVTGVTGAFTPELNNLKLNFNFVTLANPSLAQTYIESDDDFFGEFDLPQLFLSNGLVTGLEYLVTKPGGNFIFDQATFLYSVNNNSNVFGSGQAQFAPPRLVPEPSPIWGLALLAVGGAFTRTTRRPKQKRDVQRLVG